ncbi:unnamed protein product [Auanema sp. JU1783]|nr:unnamed protein product [Auanema sp. JU1783]
MTFDITMNALNNVWITVLLGTAITVVFIFGFAYFYQKKTNDKKNEEGDDKKNTKECNENDLMTMDNEMMEMTMEECANEDECEEKEEAKEEDVIQQQLQAIYSLLQETQEKISKEEMIDQLKLYK